MADKDKFSTLTIPELKKKLKKKGIASANKNKKELIELVRATEELYKDLEPCDHEESESKRRRLLNDKGKLIDLGGQKISWSKDLRSVPDINQGDVFAYLLTACEWPANKLRQYKEQDGYRMFLDKHVEDVEVGNFEETQYREFQYVQAKVKPEQRQSATRYNTWIIVATSGEIKSAGCQCVAADAGSCKHVVSLLFAMADFNHRRLDTNTEVRTDRPCYWTEPRRPSRPLRVTDLDYRHDKTAPIKAKPTPSQFRPVKDLGTDTVLEARDNIAKLCRDKKPGALFLTAIDPPMRPPDVPTLTDLATQFKLQDECPDFLDFLRVSTSEEHIIIYQNMLQEDPAWERARLGRMTASLAKDILTMRPTSAAKTVIEKVMQTKKISHPNLDHGNKYEPVARQMYYDKTTSKHKNLTVSETGLHISSDLPFLGASPDGIVSCSCHGTKLLEIKCSVKHFECKVEDIPVIDKAYHLQLKDGCVDLKKSSPWYSQVQFQMGIVGIHQCDLVLHTRKGIEPIEVQWDEEHWLQLKEKSEVVFKKHILPILLK